ncbi:DUF4291 family protein [Saccharopolyspora sp. ASAGF58]|uniref:DUF4291 family protein n=1 Tax=Saccharopolyspora sp. ASAGF58 TaxID=2719023 RepID=UPI001B3098FC
MLPLRQIRGEYDARSPTRRTHRLSPTWPCRPTGSSRPFFFNRMTWIKPSFRRLTHRSNWAQKPGLGIEG